VAFRKHVFPVLHNPLPDLCWEGFFSMFRPGSRGSRYEYVFSASLRAESCHRLAPSLEVGTRGEVVRMTPGVCCLGSGLGSVRVWEDGFCVFSVFPSSALSSYLARLSVVSSLSLPLYFNLVSLGRVFWHAGQGGVGWSSHCS